MEKEQINNIKNELQVILNKYLPEGNRFSIQDLSEDLIFLLVDLLLEKDDLERETIWAQIENFFNDNEMNLKIDFEKISSLKDQLDCSKNVMMDLGDLQKFVDADRSLEEEMNNF